MVELQKKGKGSFLWSKERGKGSFPFPAELATGGLQIEIFQASNAFFPFRAELATGGGGGYFDAHKLKSPFIFAKMRKFRLSDNEGKGSFHCEKGVLSLWERGPFSLGKGSF